MAGGPMPHDPVLPQDSRLGGRRRLRALRPAEMGGGRRRHPPKERKLAAATAARHRINLVIALIPPLPLSIGPPQSQRLPVSKVAREEPGVPCNKAIPKLDRGGEAD